MDEEVESVARGHAESAPLSVSQLTWHIKHLLERSVPKVWVEGEISDMSRPSSGHIYFTLKDDQTQVRAVIWRTAAQRMPFKLKDGMAVVACGGIEVYAPRGSYQLIVNQLQPKGIGELQLAFQQLHQKLSAQGLFDPSRKKPLPKFPKRIGFVTSPSGAAIHDFLEAAKSFWSDFSMTIIPARVQGEFAAAEISKGIRTAQKISPALDVLIVGRGGGSIEDLWCFNDEAVVRAIANCQLPTVSAVGHEIDVTLSDLAADARALTPTHAAQMLLPNREEFRTLLIQMERRAKSALWNRVKSLKQRIGNIAQRSVLARPHAIHQQRRQEVDEFEMRSRAAIFSLLERKRQRLIGLVRATEALSPLNVLQRGYSLTSTVRDGRPIRSSADVVVGEQIESVLAEGKIVSRVEQT